VFTGQGKGKRPVVFLLQPETQNMGVALFSRKPWILRLQVAMLHYRLCVTEEFVETYKNTFLSVESVGCTDKISLLCNFYSACCGGRSFYVSCLSPSMPFIYRQPSKNMCV
jgi:hypothetical protein